MKSSAVYIFLVAISISFTFPDVANAQHALSLSLSSAKILEASNDYFGRELNLEYQYKFANIKDKLFFFASIDGFYQPQARESEQLPSATDVADFENFRYGGGVLTGIHLQGSSVDAELGFGLSRHVVKIKQTSFGFLPPNFTPDYSLPRKSTNYYTTLDFVFSVSFNFSDSIFLKPFLSTQSALNKNPDASYLRPGIGLGYKF